MTTSEIRQHVKVTDFSINTNGVKINYTFQGRIELIELNPVDAAKKMFVYDILDDYEMMPLKVLHGEVWYSWDEFVYHVGIYQYAAILIAVNYELHRQIKAVSPRTLFVEIANICQDYNASLQSL